MTPPPVSMVTFVIVRVGGGTVSMEDTSVAALEVYVREVRKEAPTLIIREAVTKPRITSACVRERVSFVEGAIVGETVGLGSPT